MGLRTALHWKACRQILQEEIAIHWNVNARHCFARNDLGKFFLLVSCVINITRYRNGYCLSNFPGRYLRLHTSRSTTEEYWYLQAVERFRLCHWCDINRVDCR